jgi:hypothetical protein
VVRLVHLVQSDGWSPGGSYLGVVQARRLSRQAIRCYLAAALASAKWHR